MKEDLTGMIVHDLKNPLNAVLGLAGMPPEQHRLNIIRRAGQQMSQLVLNLLDIQKYETTSLVLQTQPLAATQLIGEALQQTEFLAEARAISYQIDADPHLQVDADSELMVRVWVNLLTNAIKYAPTGDCLLLEVRWDADRGAVFSLTDHGRGIPPEQLELIFDKFSQVSGDERSGKLRSTGLGLTFCRLTVESHGGTIAARSELGRFTTFEFNLPKARRTETAATTAPTRAVADFPNLPQALRESQADLLERIARIPIYDVSALIDNLNQLPESPEIDRWKSAVEQAAFSGDNQRLQLLLQS